MAEEGIGFLEPGACSDSLRSGREAGAPRVRVVFRIFIERHLQMKTLLGAVSVIALCLNPVMAGEGNLSDQSLARMGLAGMKNLSDSQGMQVRGLSAQAGGWSSTTLIAV